MKKVHEKQTDAIKEKKEVANNNNERINQDFAVHLGLLANEDVIKPVSKAGKLTAKVDERGNDTKNDKTETHAFGRGYTKRVAKATTKQKNPENSNKLKRIRKDEMSR